MPNEGCFPHTSQTAGMAATIAAGSATNSPARSADRLLRSRRAIADHPGRSAGSQLALPVVGSVDRLDAGQLRSVVLGYRDALRAHQEMLNRLNVYPVPDGDTGTNMALTLESVVNELDGADDIGTTIKAISHGSLMGARGNSGVILSQVLRGMTDALKGSDTVDGAMFAEALRKASDAAYGAVMRPVEGTILTVVRESATAAGAAAANGQGLAEV